MRIWFGKYKGEELASLPASYLKWLLNPELPDGEVFTVSPRIQKEAKTILDAWDSVDLEENELWEMPF